MGLCKAGQAGLAAASLGLNSLKAIKDFGLSASEPEAVGAALTGLTHLTRPSTDPVDGPQVATRRKGLGGCQCPRNLCSVEEEVSCLSIPFGLEPSDRRRTRRLAAPSADAVLACESGGAASADAAARTPVAAATAARDAPAPAEDPGSRGGEPVGARADWPQPLPFCRHID